MHQLCLGVMQKFVLLWMRGNRGIKMSASNVEAVSKKLTELKPFVPKIFAQKPRSLAEVDRWKATEFRQFLLYTGNIALNGILRPDLYEHFLVISIASSILVSPALALSCRDYAKQLMEYFVEQGNILYGDEFLVYNVHSIIHLADIVEEFGSLDACSSFLFENYMQNLKRLVKSEFSGTVEQNDEGSISLKALDNAFLLNDSSCGEVVERADNHHENEDELFVCRHYEKKKQNLCFQVHATLDLLASTRQILDGQP